MPLRRLLSGTLLVFASLVCWALVPASADAALLGSTLESAVEAAPQPVHRATEDVAGAARPATGPEPAAPPPDADGGAVQQTVAPIAGTTGTAAPSSAVAVPATHLREPAHGRVSHISASVSAARRPDGRGATRPGTTGRAAEWSGPAAENGVGPRSARRADALTSAARHAAPAQPAPEPPADLNGADGAAAGASSGFFFGGGFALLVTALLLAGPRLRRRLPQLPAVCRPAAFLVVLERPG
jgi:hypothetical protein